MENLDTNAVDRRLYEIGRSWAEQRYSAETRLLGTEVRGAAAYALFLTAGGDPEDCRKAEAIVDAVVEQQEADTASPFYGYFRTASDAAEYADPNWSAFCGSYLMHISRAYGDRVGERCRQAVREAALRACASIQKREVSPGYTNMALLSAALLTVSGEAYGASEYLEAGRQRMRALVEHINLTGGFQEYNSPTYCGVSLSALCWMCMFAADEEVRDLALRVQARLWHTLAMHYHRPTGQLAGPYSRAYGNLLQRYAGAVKYYLYKVLGEDFDLGENEVHGHDTAYAGLAALQEVACPEAAAEALRSSGLPRTVEETVRTDGRPLGPDYVGPFEQMTTHLTDSYALGTINAKDCWSQRRNLVVHWTGSEGRPVALTEGVRENDAPARDQDVRFWSVQKAGRALALYDLTGLEGKELASFTVAVQVEAEALPEIRSGEKEVEELPRAFAEGSAIFIQSGEACIAIRFEAEGFGGARAAGEMRAVAGGVELALDLYRGESKTVSAETLAGVYCACAVEVREVGSKREMRAFRKAFEGEDLQVGPGEEGLSVRWRSEDAVLAIAPTGEGGARQYEGIVDGLPVNPERLVAEAV